MTRLAFFLFLTTAGLMAGDTGQGPQIQFEETEFHHGTVKQYSQVVHEFHFTNTGDGLLKIERVEAS